MRSLFTIVALLTLALLGAATLQSQQSDVRATNRHVDEMTNVSPFIDETASSSEPDVEKMASTEFVVPETEAPKTESPTAAPSKATQTVATPPPAPTITIATTPPPRYSYDPKTTETLNTETRSALVNILCRTSGSVVPPISGSGIIIDPRGVILTNAHVAQYLLLSTKPEINLSCVIRTDSPAKDRWSAEILYISPIWMQEHAQDILNAYSKSTGEHDFALLRITGSVTSDPLPGAFPYLPVETRGPAIREGDLVVLAAYPAEFSQGSIARGILSVVSAVTNIKQLLTFKEQTVDVVSLGSIALAQSGSSGGAVVNAWGYVVGVISTTSEGETTAERDLRAITGSYINRALIEETGSGLTLLPSQDIAFMAAEFNRTYVPALTQQLIDALTR